MSGTSKVKKDVKMQQPEVMHKVFIYCDFKIEATDQLLVRKDGYVTLLA